VRDGGAQTQITPQSILVNGMAHDEPIRELRPVPATLDAGIAGANVQQAVGVGAKALHSFHNDLHSVAGRLPPLGAVIIYRYDATPRSQRDSVIR
jgi:hypothetical protein